MAARGGFHWLRWLEVAAFVAAAATILYALASGSARRHYDVDEIQHTHVMWRITVGDRPFHDFVESHPPFVWFLGAPLLRLAPSPQRAIGGFRILASIAGLLFLFLALASAWAARRSLDVRFLLAGALLILCDKRNLDYFLEARPDSFAYGLLFAAFLLFLREKPDGPFLRYLSFAFLASTALLWTPKFVVLVVVFALADLVLARRTKPALALALAGHAAGVALALAAGLFFLRAAGIDPLLAYDLSIGFHQRFFSETAFSRGLLRSVREQPVQLAAVLAGVTAWVGLILAGRLRPAAFEIGVLGFLGVSVLTVPLPYKQYFVPWFAVAAVFVPFAGAALRRWGEGVSHLALAGLLGFAIFSGARALAEYRKFDQVVFFHDIWDLMGRAAAADGRIVTDPQWHPIFRRDVFYGWFSTYDPGGRGQERILREWSPRGLGSRFTREGYLAEIRRHPPALIVTVGDGFNLPPAQEEAVAEHVRESRDAYVPLKLAGKLGLLVRREQANWDFLEQAGLARRR
jgi:hypothetical protein